MQSEDLKEKGNACVKEEKYAEAILHYTHAIAKEPQNSLLYGNRSLAFLKMDQFYLAYQDALEAIRLSPNWPKGYYRKAEVEHRAEHYEQAVESFRVRNALFPFMGRFCLGVALLNVICCYAI